MPWQETDPVQERQEFVIEYLKRDRSFSALCRDFGVSRKTGYKWVSRFMSGGLVALVDESRARDTMAHKTPAAIEELVVAMRLRHPTWGPKKIVRRLQSDHPRLEFPAFSTAAAILKKRGLVVSRRRREARPVRPTAPALRGIDKPNATWAADFKGQYRLGNGVTCYPATVTDLYSRKLLRCQALTSTLRGPMQQVLDSAFREYGIPDALRSDNGPPFRHGRGELRLSKLAVFLIELGISPEYIEPGKPQQNGSHERMHRTLKAEAISPPAADPVEQQDRFDRFRQEFNSERPHEALGLRTPSELYTPSTRPYPDTTEPSYPSYAHVRKAGSSGQIFWLDTAYVIAAALNGKYLGLEQICDGLLRVQFHSKVLGMIDEEEKLFIPNVEWPSPEMDLTAVTHDPG